jgi:hypothetical protein
MRNSIDTNYGVNKSLAGNVTLPELETIHSVILGFIISIAGGGSPVGVVHIEGTIDGKKWVSIKNKAISADGDTFIDVADWAYEKARLTYARTSGDGTMQVQSLTKGV